MALSRGTLLSDIRGYLLPLLAGILVAVPFVYPIFSPLSWFALLPLFRALQPNGTLKRAFFCGWLAGGVANIAGFYWLDYTIRLFGGFPYGVSEFIFLLFAAYGALPMALFALLVRLCGYGPLQLFPALFWVAIEFCYPLFFPWHLANSQSEFLSFIQTADLVGPYGTSFLLVWLNTIFYAAISPRGESSGTLLRDGAVAALLLIAAFSYGHLRLRGVDADISAARFLKAAAIQGDIDIRHKWNMATMESNLHTYRELTKEIRDADLVIWPETAVEAWLPESLGQLPAEILPALPRDSGFIFGARSFRGNPATTNVKAFNSAFLTDARGQVLNHYHKQVLLAFGEYLPFASLLSKLPGVPPLGDGFTAGAGPRIFQLSDGTKIAPLICYEDLMPNLARGFVAGKGANLLVNLTNDAWFGDTAAPWQHARLAQWRAIETRRSLIRVTNTGLTAVITPRGEIINPLPTFSSAALTEKVAIMEGETLYVRWGDWFAWLITIISSGILLFCRRSSGGSRRQ